MKNKYIFKIILASIIAMQTLLAYAQTIGANSVNPFQVGTLIRGQTYNYTHNNSPANGFGNDYGQPSDDIYYKFTLATSGIVNVSHCGSTFDTYLHILDAQGNLVASNDDGGPFCSTLQASLSEKLYAGTYFIVSEGYATNIGNINIVISLGLPMGANFGYPIDAGTLYSGATFTDTKNNAVANGFGDDYGRVSEDIYYKFKLNTAAKVSISHCSSNFDTYLHLLDVTGNLLTFNDDNGPLCPSMAASIKMELPAGIYYVVSEGWSSVSGNITTSISTPAPEFVQTTDSLLQNLNKNRMNTQILYDRAYPLASVHDFNATRADTTANKHFRQAYKEMFDAAYNKQNWLLPTDVSDIALGKALATATVPIAIANYRFNVIDTNAIVNGTILQIDSMYYDATPTSNPYKTINTLMASPMVDSVASANNTIVYNFSPDLYLNQSSLSITSLSVNFGNGSVAQNIPVNTNFSTNVSYPTSGFKTLKFTATFSNGTSQITYALIKVKITNNTTTLATTNLCNKTSAEIGFWSTLPFQGYDETSASLGFGQYKIFYATNGTCDGILRKPIIVVDGFDPGDDNKIPGFYDMLNVERVEKGNRFADSLRAQGYDVVLLNFPTYQIGWTKILTFKIPKMRDGGADYIERNAMILIELIKKINSSKLGTEKLTIIGPSMGGLISRYALAYMEKNNMLHNTKLWLSFDSPHKGANIAIGNQYFLDFFSPLSDDAKNNLVGKIGSVAAKQMLVNHYLGTPVMYKVNTVLPTGAPDFRDRFQAAIDAMGFPKGDLGQSFRKIALIDGNTSGSLVNAACQKAFTMDVRRLKKNILFLIKTRIRTYTVASAKMYFTPSYGNSCIAFDGKSALTSSKYSYPIYAYTPSNTAGYDTAPGGTFATQQTLEAQGNKDIKILGGFLNYESKFYSVIPNHSFINTKSALAFKGANQDLAENISTRSLVCTNETPFDSYFADFTQNRDHVELWPAAVDWVKKEINGQPQAVIFKSPYNITGPASFCTTTTYTIPNLPVGSTVTWAAAGTIAISGSVNANPVTVVKAPNSPGVGTLNATINSVCGSTVAVPKSINAGLLPVTPDFSESQVPVTMAGNPLEPTVCIPWGTSKQIKIRIRNVQNLQVTPIYGTSTLSSGSEYITYQFNYNLAVCVIIVDYDTDCGHITNSILVRNPCYNPNYTFAVSPNPANNTLKVSQETNLSPVQSKAATPLAQEMAVTKASFEVKLFDDKGNVVLNDRSTPDSKDITLITQNIPNGFYFLHITEGKETVIKQIIIKH